MYGEPVFATISPSSRHSGLVLRFSRVRAIDPFLGHEDMPLEEAQNIGSSVYSNVEEEAEILVDLPDYDARKYWRACRGQRCLRLPRRRQPSTSRAGSTRVPRATCRLRTADGPCGIPWQLAGLANRRRDRRRQRFSAALASRALPSEGRSDAAAKRWLQCESPSPEGSEATAACSRAHPSGRCKRCQTSCHARALRPL